MSPTIVADTVDAGNAFYAIPNSVTTPVNVHVLSYLLRHHPDRELVAFLVKGFSQGFDIMFAGPVVSTNPKNLKSARDHKEAVSRAILTEVARGHTAGPFSAPPFPVTHCSPLGAVAKDSGEVRLILDLSQPTGASINEGIIEEYCTVKYTSFDSAVALVQKAGQGAKMSKIDIKHAFRLCPVRKEDWPLLCYAWLDRFFVDLVLPFGSRSSPGIFNNFADALAWILATEGGIAALIHYLDDYFMCSEDSDLLDQWMQAFIAIFAWLGVPISHEKTVHPCTCLIFLGIEIDSVAQCIRLPKDKFDALMLSLNRWASKKKCTKKDLLSLIGSLSFAAKVVKPGRIFLRRLIDLSKTVTQLHYHIDLNKEARLDIAWWLDFLPFWNGISMFQEEFTSSDSLEFFTDASDMGFGGVLGNHWFSQSWPAQFSSFHINVREAFALYAALSIWVSPLTNKQIIFFCDNASVVDVWSKGSSKDPDLMRILRPFFIMCASHNINFLVRHIPGKSNVNADLLSRLQVTRFLELNPNADAEASILPSSTWDI